MLFARVAKMKGVNTYSIPYSLVPYLSRALLSFCLSPLLTSPVFYSLLSLSPVPDNTIIKLWNTILTLYLLMMSAEKLLQTVGTLYPLLSTGSTQEEPSPHDWKIVNWDVKNQNKQTNTSFWNQFRPNTLCLWFDTLIVFLKESFATRTLPSRHMASK